MQSNEKTISKRGLPKPLVKNSENPVQRTHAATIIQRARLNPGSLTPCDILQLQRAIGNQAVQRVLQGNPEEFEAELTETASLRFGHNSSRSPIHPPADEATQTKPAIDKPCDESEQEADAREEMDEPAPENSRPAAIQRKCAECEDEEKKPVQATPAYSAYTGVTLNAVAVGHTTSVYPMLQRQPASPSPTPSAAPSAGLDADDQKIVDAAKREAANFKCDVAPVLWGILHKYFPNDLRKVAGTGCEAALPGLRTEFSTTDPKDPKVKRSVPIIYAGKAFIASTDAAQLNQRVTDVTKQLELIDDWRLANFLIDEKDLSNNRITGQLRSLSNDKLIDYRDKTKDSEVKRYVENLVTFSTPTQAGAAIDPITGNMELQIGQVRVVIEPDTRGVTGLRGADTGANLELQPPGIPGFKTDAKGVVTDFPGYSPIATLKVRTRYGAGYNPEFTAGYGRGTTPDDIRNKARSLRFHEGSHGEDFINFVRQNPLPVFEGKNGDAQTDFLASRRRYLDALSDWGKRLKATKIPGECVGKSIDEFHKGEAGYKPICP
jgi:hypothetical protein